LLLLIILALFNFNISSFNTLHNNSSTILKSSLFTDVSFHVDKLLKKATPIYKITVINGKIYLHPYALYGLPNISEKDLEDLESKNPILKEFKEMFTIDSNSVN
jgi:hypothetical protein